MAAFTVSSFLLTLLASSNIVLGEVIQARAAICSGEPAVRAAVSKFEEYSERSRYYHDAIRGMCKTLGEKECIIPNYLNGFPKEVLTKACGCIASPTKTACKMPSTTRSTRTACKPRASTDSRFSIPTNSHPSDTTLATSSASSIESETVTSSDASMSSGQSSIITTSGSSLTSAATSSDSPTSSSDTTQTTSSLPTSTAVYNPPIPSSYENCVADPNVVDTQFELLRSDSGIPIVNVNGHARVAGTVAEAQGYYRFEKPANADVPDGVYDVVFTNGQGSAYFAVLESGEVVFTSTSSKGQSYISQNGKTFVSTIFSISCNGDITFGVLGSAEFQLVLGDDETLFAQPKAVAPAKQKRNPISGPVVNIVGHIIKEVITPDPSSIQRCPATPTGLSPRVRPGAREPSSNGCGADWVVDPIPDAWFTDCCNEHDLCFDNCIEGEFGPCNDSFRTCNLHVCETTFPGNSPAQALKRLGCRNLANTYGDAVKTYIGVAAFKSANSDRCECKCRPGDEGCDEPVPTTSSPAPTSTPPPGDCGGKTCWHLFLGTGRCINQQCVFEPWDNQWTSCPRAVCGTHWACGNVESPWINPYCFCELDYSCDGFNQAHCSGLKECKDQWECDAEAGSFCTQGTCCGKQKRFCLPKFCQECYCGRRPNMG